MVAHSQFDPIVVLLFSVFRAVFAEQDGRPETQLKIGHRAVGEFGDDGETCIGKIHDGCDRGREIKNIEGLLLTGAKIKIMAPKIGLAVGAIEQSGRARESAVVSGILEMSGNCGRRK